MSANPWNPFAVSEGATVTIRYFNEDGSELAHSNVTSARAPADAFLGELSFMASFSNWPIGKHSDERAYLLGEVAEGALRIVEAFGELDCWMRHSHAARGGRFVNKGNALRKRRAATRNRR